MSESNKFAAGQDFDESFIEKIVPPYTKSKEELWDTISATMDSTSPSRKYFRVGFLQVGIAASLLLLISLALTAKFYSQTIYCPKGKLLLASLPDNTLVELNADSEISFHPFWWWASRSISLKGEAFFTVKNGETFRVNSKNGTTEVLGTKFNVFDREENYQVSCAEGQVKVSSRKKNDVIIEKGKAAILQQTGDFQIIDKVDKDHIGAWRKNRLTFTSVPLDLVLKEIERQYNIEIEYKSTKNHKFTGSFNTRNDLEQVLKIVCKPFILNFERISETSYRISTP